MSRQVEEEGVERPLGQVWLLAASTGGLQAVTAFLNLLPSDSDIAFVYAQHIDPSQTDAMMRTLARHSALPVQLGQTGIRLRPGTVTVAHSGMELRIGRDGELLQFGTPWQGGYAPSIDQLGKRIALLFGERSGVVIFTGMGKDGIVACQSVIKKGGRVLVQSPQSCTVDALPQAVLRNTAVNFIGDVAELAQQFWHSPAEVVTST